MDIKVNQAQMVTQVPDTVTTETGDGTFKFTLASAITDAELQAKVDSLLSDITFQGNRIAEHMDIRDMKKYRGLIRLIDANLDELAQELVKDEKDHITILSKIGEIQGLLLDILT